MVVASTYVIFNMRGKSEIYELLFGSFVVHFEFVVVFSFNFPYTVARITDDFLAEYVSVRKPSSSADIFDVSQHI